VLRGSLRRLGLRCPSALLSESPLSYARRCLLLAEPYLIGCRGCPFERICKLFRAVASSGPCISLFFPFPAQRGLSPATSEKSMISNTGKALAFRVLRSSSWDSPSRRAGASETPLRGSTPGANREPNRLPQIPYFPWLSPSLETQDLYRQKLRGFSRGNDRSQHGDAHGRQGDP